MTVTQTTASTAITASSALPNGAAQTGLGSLGQADFLRLLTVQMQQQDPLDPVDQKEMLAQMAQFTSLSGIAEMGQTLKTIASKLDAVIAAQETAFGLAVAPDGDATTPATNEPTQES